MTQIQNEINSNFRTEQKHKLLSENTQLHQDSLNWVSINLAGVPIELGLQGQNRQQEELFLSSYYKPFLSPVTASQSSVKVVFTLPPEPFDDPKNSIWWDPDPECFIFPERENPTRDEGTQIIQRDFAALADNKFNRLTVICPRLSISTTDSLDNLMSLILSRKGPEYGVFSLHSAAIVRTGKAYVFFGDSGVGKSTIAHRSYQKYKYPVIGGDQVILKITPSGLRAQSSSIKIFEFPRPHPALDFSDYPVGGLFNLIRSDESCIRKISSSAFLMNILKQTVPYLTGEMDYNRFLELCKKACELAPHSGYQFSYPLSVDPWEVIDEYFNDKYFNDKNLMEKTIK